MRRLIGLTAAGLVAMAGSAAMQSPPQGLGPRTLGPSQVMCTDLPVDVIPTPSLYVAGGQNGTLKQSFAKNELIVIPGGLTANVNIGNRYIARRGERTYYVDPMRQESFTAVRTSGWVTVVASDELYALARVDFGCDEVVQGDYLEPYTETVLPTASGPVPPGGWNFDDRARVLFGVDRREMFADGDLFSFDRGAVQGVKPGDRVGVYRDRRLRQIPEGERLRQAPVPQRDRATGALLPLVEMGEAVVVEVQAETAKAVVVRIYGDRIETNDTVVRRK